MREVLAQSSLEVAWRNACTARALGRRWWLSSSWLGVFMRPVDPSVALVGNFGASHYVRLHHAHRRESNDAGAGAESAGTGLRSCAPQPRAPDASGGCRSSGCNGRSGCTTQTGPGTSRTSHASWSLHTHLGKPEEPEGRVRSEPYCCGLAFVGAAQGAVRSSSFIARETAAAPTLFGMSAVVA